MSESTIEATKAMIDPVTGEIIGQKELAERLLVQSKEHDVSPVGPGGLLDQVVATPGMGGPTRGLAPVLVRGGAANLMTGPGACR